MKIPFGRYRGVDLANVPSSYLEWLAGIPLREALKAAVEAELASRGGRGYSQAADFKFSFTDRETARRIVEAGRRSLARAEHPDVGGSVAIMTHVNVVADAMLEALS